MDSWMHSWILLHQGHHLPVQALRGVQAPVVVEVVPVREVLVVHDVGEVGQQTPGLQMGSDPVVAPAPHGHWHPHGFNLVKGWPQLGRGETLLLLGGSDGGGV